MCERAGVEINWWEEVLHPDDFDGHIKLKQALPHVKFTTGEHEYSKWVYKRLLLTKGTDSESSLRTERWISSSPTSCG